MPQSKPRSIDDPEEEDPFDPEVTEGGKPKTPELKQHTLGEFLSETFADTEGMPEELTESRAPDPATGTLPSIAWLKANFKTKSAMIRHLVSLDFPPARISKLLGVKYQHVRNVKMTPLKRGPNEPWNLEVKKALEAANTELKDKQK